MSNNLIDREITQGIIPIGTPKAYKYDAALVEAAKATVQQGMTDIASKIADTKDEISNFANTKMVSYAIAAANSASAAKTSADQLAAYVAEKGEVTSPLVDTTLTINGAAADAKVTGDNITALNKNIQSLHAVAISGDLNNKTSSNIAGLSVEVDGCVIKLNGTVSGASSVRYYSLQNVPPVSYANSSDFYSGCTISNTLLGGHTYRLHAVIVDGTFTSSSGNTHGAGTACSGNNTLGVGGYVDGHNATPIIAGDGSEITVENDTTVGALFFVAVGTGVFNNAVIVAYLEDVTITSKLNTTDKTLSFEGLPADAKETGDNVNGLKTQIHGLNGIAISGVDNNKKSSGALYGLTVEVNGSIVKLNGTVSGNVTATRTYSIQESPIRAYLTADNFYANCTMANTLLGGHQYKLRDLILSGTCVTSSGDILKAGQSTGMVRLMNYANGHNALPSLLSSNDSAKEMFSAEVDTVAGALILSVTGTTVFNDAVIAVFVEDVTVNWNSSLRHIGVIKDINNAKTTGIWDFGSKNIENRPIDFENNAGYLIVLRTTDYIYQTIIRRNDNVKWERYYAINDSTFTEWEKSGFGYRGSIQDAFPSQESFALSDISGDGWYQVPASQLSKITDLPTEVTDTMILENYKGPTVFWQVLRDRSGNRWERSESSDWVYFPFPSDVTGVTACIIGASVAAGTTHETSTSGAHIDANKAFLTVALRANGVTVTNLSHGGMGYLRTASDGTVFKDIIDNTDFTDYMSAYVTVGSNDWNYNFPLGTPSDTGTETVCGMLKYAIEKIYTSHPKIKLFVRTPDLRATRGSFETQWGWNTHNEAPTGPYTLKDLHDAIKAICDAYCVEVIEAVPGVVNAYNILTAFPDRTHPSKAVMAQMARDMTGRIKFK